jgi:hypothetical protein
LTAISDPSKKATAIGERTDSPLKEGADMSPDVHWIRGRAWWLIAPLFAVLLALILVPSTRAKRATAAAGTPSCSVTNLRVDKVGENDFTSHRSWDLALRNVASTTCQMKGFPGVRLLDRNARAEATVVGHVLGPPHTVVLRPWHRAFFGFTFTVSGPCSAAVFAYGVRVSPPRSTRRVVYYHGRFDLCGPGPAHVTVSPLMSRRPF